MHRNCYFLIDDCFKCSVISEDLCEYVYCLAHLQCAEKWGDACMFVCVGGCDCVKRNVTLITEIHFWV